MPASADSSPATSPPATPAPGRAVPASPHFSPSHLPIPSPISSAAVLPLSYPLPVQPMPRPRAPGFPPAAPSRARWPSRGALGSAAALSLSRLPTPRVPVAPRLFLQRTTSLHLYKETASPEARVAPPASSPDAPV